jgi:glycosyltransferase involved in cell wall biosynthesis
MIEASPPFPFPNIQVENRIFKIAGRLFVLQPLIWRVLRGEFDGAVIGAEVKYLSNLVIAFLLRLRGRPVILWGFGYHQYDRPQRSMLARVTAGAAGSLKRIVCRVSSGYLVYTKGGERALRSWRPPLKRIAVLRNTIDSEREKELRAKVALEPVERATRELGVRSESVKLLYFGRLVPTKHVELLLEYARRCIQTGRSADVIIFGQGSEEQRLRLLAANLSNVVFHRHDDLKLARALRISAAVVIPGYVGLAITHGFAHGVTTLTRHGQLHSPEIEYLEHGINGLILPEHPDEFFTALDAFVDDQDLQRRLARGAERSAQTIDMGHMVDTFRNLVAECLEPTIRGPSK